MITGALAGNPIIETIMSLVGGLSGSNNQVEQQNKPNEIAQQPAKATSQPQAKAPAQAKSETTDKGKSDTKARESMTVSLKKGELTTIDIAAMSEKDEKGRRHPVEGVASVTGYWEGGDKFIVTETKFKDKHGIEGSFVAHREDEQKDQLVLRQDGKYKEPLTTLPVDMKKGTLTVSWHASTKLNSAMDAAREDR